MSKMYQEAIVEAKKLRELAEENAKKAILEASLPRLREYIEKELLGETADIADDDDLLADIATDMSSDVAMQDPAVASHQAVVGDEVSMSLPDADGKITLDLDGLHDGGHEDPALPSADMNVDGEDDDLQLTPSGAAALSKMQEASMFRKKLSTIKNNAKLLKALTTEGADKDIFEQFSNKMNKDVSYLQEMCIRIARGECKSIPQQLVTEFKELHEEIENMATRDSKRFALHEDAEEMDLDVDLDSDGASDDDVVEIPSDLADELFSVLGDELDMQGEEDEEEDDLPDMDAEPAEDLDMPADDEEVELDLGDDEDLEEAAACDVDESEELVEIDEAMLRKELAKMKKLAETKSKVHAASILDDFGGAKEEREAFVDSDDSDINVHAESRKLKAQLQKESRRNRALMSKLEEYSNTLTEYRQQLLEMNLFNAKLLYMNKLMQNTNMTRKQKAAVVEALDKAKTLNEARLVYRSHMSALPSNGSSASSSLNESARRAAGSSSKSTASASSTETQMPSRWAQLAGLKE